MDEAEEATRAAYDRDPELEWTRLTEKLHARLEYEVTSHALGRHLPSPPARILDAGGGPGRYTIDLAARGYVITLLDHSPSMLDFARARIAEAGPTIERNVESIVEGSIVDLSTFSDAGFDAVLCLGGVLSYVTEREQRRRALRELSRVAKPGAPLFVSAMNRLSGYRGAIQWLEEFDRIFPRSDGRSELLNGARVYEFWPEELVADLSDVGLPPETVYGSAGVAAGLPEASLEALRRSPERWRRWHDAFLATC